jgi:hypothetical protein
MLCPKEASQMVKRYTLNVYGKRFWNPGDDGECEYHFAEKIPQGRYSIILESEADALAERCERLEGALRHCENMLMKFDINRIDGEEISDETLGVIRSALSGSSGGKDG